jgi:hypothetical protein
MPDVPLTWAAARPMLFALRSLSRSAYANGATLTFPGGYTGTVEDGQLILSHDDDVIFCQPVNWPISKSMVGVPDPNQLTLDVAEGV